MRRGRAASRGHLMSNDVPIGTNRGSTSGLLPPVLGKEPAMRRMKPLSLALAGLALSAATAAEAGLPTADGNNNGQPPSPRRGVSLHAHKPKKVHLCAACAAKMAAQGANPGSAGCASCGDSAGTMTPTMMAGSTPGYAVIGDGSPSPMMAASGPGASGAPGYAIVGGTIASSEPAPIGVMRTTYNNDSQSGSLGASVDIMHGQGQGSGMGGGWANAPHAKASEMPGSLYSPQVRRRSMVSRLIGLPDFGRRAAEMEQRKRDAHAQTAYGPSSMPSELPASMVYGGGSR